MLGKSESLIEWVGDFISTFLYLIIFYIRMYAAISYLTGPGS